MCPPPAHVAWREACDPCRDTIVVVERACPPAPDCCGAGGFIGAEHVVTDGIIAGSESEVIVEAVRDTAAPPQVTSDSQSLPSAAPESRSVAAEPRPAGLEPVAPPPSLAPAGDVGAVQTTSVEQPVAESTAPAPGAEPPAAEVDEPSVLAAEPEMKQPIGEVAETPAVEPVETAEGVAPEEPLAPAEEAVAPAADEPEMREDAPLPGDEPASPAEPPMDEEAEAPAVTPPAEPETVPPEPAAEPEPVPADENIFEELDAEGDAVPAADDAEEMADEPAAVEPAAADDEAAGEPEAESPADPTGDPLADEPQAEPEMVEDEPAAPDAGSEEPADPFAEDGAVPAADGEPTDDSEPAGEPADPFAGSEPVRRWIDVTGTASMVAALVEVGADGRCVLEARGRRIAVPVENLSDHDRDYVRQAGARLAKLRADKAGETAAAAPAPTDTAGL
jgi:hypothetical protein